METLKHIAKYPLIVPTKVSESGKPYSCINPSLAYRHGELIGIVRTVNYDCDDAWFRIYDADRKIRTENVLCGIDLSRGDDTTSVVEWSCGLDDPEYHTRGSGMFWGLEDMILFPGDDASRFTATVLYNGSHSQICSGTIDWDRRRVSSLTTYLSRTPEKNWLPYVTNEGAVEAIYSYSPLVTMCLGDAGQRFSVPVRRVAPSASIERHRGYKGSAPPVPYERNGTMGYLIVVHESPNDEHGKRIYVHRFMWLDALTMVPVAESEPFVFEKRQVEFCRSMVVLGSGDIALGVGIRDTTAWIYVTTRATVLGMLTDM